MPWLEKQWKDCQYYEHAFESIQTYQTYRLIVPNRRHLRAQHDDREHGKQHRLERQEEQQNDGGRRRERRALLPLVLDALRKLIDGQEDGMYRGHGNVELQMGRNALQKNPQTSKRLTQFSP